jgi:hypothetical protein
MLLDDTLNMHERLSHPPFPTVVVGVRAKKKRKD